MSKLPKFDRADQLSAEDKKLNRSRRRFLLTAVAGTAATVVTDAAANKPVRRWIIDPHTSLD